MTLLQPPEYWALRLLQDSALARRWWAYVVAPSARLYPHYAFFVVVAQNLVAGLLLLRHRVGRNLGRCWGAGDNALAMYLGCGAGAIPGWQASGVLRWNLDTARASR